MRFFIGLMSLLFVASVWPTDAQAQGFTGNRRVVADDGGIYDGVWVNGRRNGYGVQIFPGGDRYEGGWRNDLRHGQGVYVFTTGDRYSGSHADHKFHGQGTFYWANGDRYEGMWYNDKAHGYGSKSVPDGRVFSGEWVNGCFRQGDRWATAGATRSECGFR